MRRRFDEPHAKWVETGTRMALECIGDSDALLPQCRAHHAGDARRPGHPARPYAAQASFRRRLYPSSCGAPVHDIGYVRGLFKEDDEDGFIIDEAGTKVALPRGAWMRA